tara:strand:- start:3901 stop:4059 length:159 start_codon:yes stop_codon:yes gene_type:complete
MSRVDLFGHDSQAKESNPKLKKKRRKQSVDAHNTNTVSHNTKTSTPGHGGPK